MFNWLKPRSKVLEGFDDQSLRQQVEDYVKEVCGDSFYPECKVKESATGLALLNRPDQQQIATLYITLASYIKRHKRTMTGLGRSYNSQASCEIEALQQLMILLMRRNLPYTEQDLLALMHLANDNWNAFAWYRPHNALFGLLERTYKTQIIPEPLVKAVRKSTRLAHQIFANSSENRKLIERGKRLIGEGTKFHLKGDFDWSRKLLKQLNNFDDPLNRAWFDLLEHAQTAEASKPSKKWLASAADHIERIGEQNFATNLCDWLSSIQQEKPDNLPLSNDLNATVVRGLIWSAVLVSADAVASDIRTMAVYSFRKVKDVGAVSPKVGNACLHVLGQLPGLVSVAMLSELLQKIKYPSARRLVEKALDAAAERNQMSRDDLVEISMPDFGLDEQGQIRQQLGGFTAILSIEAGQKVQLVWQKSDGKIQKTIPAAIKQPCAEEIKDLKNRLKEIQTTLQAQKNRIEKLFLKPKPWAYREWRERYLDHRLMRHLCDKLVWQFDGDSFAQTGMMIDDQLRNAESQIIEAELAARADNVKVRLWHPVRTSLEEVMAWRKLISDTGITQPFKQAHREVYLLTDAERRTEQYSNRFAAHILKQHQLNALCQQRGWLYSLQGTFDSWNAPTLHLPEWNLKVEFYVDGVESSENDMGIFNYVSSDQVRFLRNAELLSLEQVEPIVFSEILRDVDLFIGVCSIGNDPGWNDGGIHPGFDEYWREYAFGELLESANTRKEILAQLLPKLKIASECEISGRFLKVRGEYRCYKIHLGSANILMEPNDQYLCIVEGRETSPADSRKLVLPFEGDHRLSVILSKAFLLAADNKITDKTILNQINLR